MAFRSLRIAWVDTTDSPMIVPHRGGNIVSGPYQIEFRGADINFLPSLSKQNATRDAYSSSRLISTSTP